IGESGSAQNASSPDGLLSVLAGLLTGLEKVNWRQAADFLHAMQAETTELKPLVPANHGGPRTDEVPTGIEFYDAAPEASPISDDRGMEWIAVAVGLGFFRLDNLGRRRRRSRYRFDARAVSKRNS